MLSGFAVAAAFAAGQRRNGHTVTPVSVATGRRAAAVASTAARPAPRAESPTPAVASLTAEPAQASSRRCRSISPVSSGANLAAGQREAGAPGGDGGAAVRGAGQQPAEGMVIRPAFVRMRPSGSGVDD
jgi:hypothetical protein